MKCYNCQNPVEKKFQHPFIDEEWLCFDCFNSRISKNHTTVCSSGSKILNIENFSEASAKDDLKLSFILCSVGANSNTDGFDDEGLSTDYHTAKLQSIDWEHSPETIGVITESEYVAASNKDRQEALGIQLDKSVVNVQGILWKLKNKTKAKEVIKRYSSGMLYYSMEDYFDYVICSSCNEKFVYDNEYCSHLKSRFSTSSDTYRILRGNKFVGAGVVKNPADRDAKGLSVAKKLVDRYKIIANILDPDLQDYYNYMLRKRI